MRRNVSLLYEMIAVLYASRNSQDVTVWFIAYTIYHQSKSRTSYCISSLFHVDGETFNVILLLFCVYVWIGGESIDDWTYIELPRATCKQCTSNIHVHKNTRMIILAEILGFIPWFFWNSLQTFWWQRDTERNDTQELLYDSFKRWVSHAYEHIIFQAIFKLNTKNLNQSQNFPKILQYFIERFFFSRNIPFLGVLAIWISWRNHIQFI